jgi:tellurite resistance protein TerC
MAFTPEKEMQPDKSLVVRIARKIIPMTRKIRGDWFFTRRLKLWVASPLFMVLLVVESSDLVFALDSIPAIFAITTDPFIVLTSNIFAIMGLRALYFLLSGAIGMFMYLKYGISFILAFVGIKMIMIMLDIHIPVTLSLFIIVVSILISIGISLILKPKTSIQTQ